MSGPVLNGCRGGGMSGLTSCLGPQTLGRLDSCSAAAPPNSATLWAGPAGRRPAISPTIAGRIAGSSSDQLARPAVDEVDGLEEFISGRPAPSVSLFQEPSRLNGPPRPSQPDHCGTPEALELEL